MVRIAPVRLTFNPKTLWFDAGELELRQGDPVVVSTARGKEFGRVSQAPFEMDYEKTKKLNSPLKPVIRIATEEDESIADEKGELSMRALPVFRHLAAEYAPDMNPVAVEYLFDNDKAVFYFDAEERVDFRDLVRKLASELEVRVDMKQIGVRDGARMVGGLGHCGQELCCTRLGGQFNPVSIRMAKEQDLSLNPQKISGCCGRLMCCLRYEFDAYKDFHSRAPKKNARIDTPDGEGRVVELDVPREVVSIKIGDDKPVKVPLADMDAPEEGTRPKSVGKEAWEKANAPVTYTSISSSSLFSSQFSGEDQLAEPGKVTRMHGDEGSKSTRTRRRRGRRGGSGSSKSENSKQQGQQKQQKQQQQKQQKQQKQKQQGERTQQRKQRRRSTKVSSDGATKVTEQKKNVQVGRNSSGLRSGRDEKRAENTGEARAQAGSHTRRRRRSHTAGSAADGGKND